MHPETFRLKRLVLTVHFIASVAKNPQVTLTEKPKLLNPNFKLEKLGYRIYHLSRKGKTGTTVNQTFHYKWMRIKKDEDEDEEDEREDEKEKEENENEDEDEDTFPSSSRSLVVLRLCNQQGMHPTTENLGS